MNAYADTGLLVSLYGQDDNSVEARALAERHRPTFLLTAFGEAEFANACQLRVFRKQWTRQQARAVYEDFRSDLREGVLRVEELRPEVWNLAATLSQRYTANLGTRALDVLHVAMALALDPEAFCTFDERQRKLARAKGLRVLPRK